MDNKLWMNHESVQEDIELSSIFPDGLQFPPWLFDSEMKDNLFETCVTPAGLCSNPFNKDPFNDELATLLDGCNVFWDDMVKEEQMIPLQHNTKEESTVGNKRVSEEGVLTSDGCTGFWGDNDTVIEARMLKREDMRPLQHNTKEDSTVANKRVREERVLTFEEVSQYFYMPIIQAAKELNVGLTLLKKKCRELGIPRWPHRKMKSMQTLIKNVQELAWKEGSVARSAIEVLEKEQKLMEMRPSVQMQDGTRRLRQACFKANYKKRKLMAGKERVTDCYLLDMI